MISTIYFILKKRCLSLSYKFIDEWKKFNETSLPKKVEFPINLNMADNTDSDYMHAKRVYKDFEIKKIR